MKWLTMIRHAKSSWEDAVLPDISRPLSERGRNATVLMARHLKRMEIHPDKMITSPANRAVHTAINFANILKFKKQDIQIEPDLYYGTPDDVMNILKKVPDTFHDVFIIGHEPGWSELAKLITGEEYEKIPTCSVIRMSFEMETWKKLAKSTGKKEFFITPKELINKKKG